MALALLAWVSCFAVLASVGTWIPFAFVGLLLVGLTLRSAAVPLVQFRLTSQRLLLGVGAGLLMVLLTHLAYRWVSAILPAVRPQTLELISLLRVVGVSP